MERALNASMIIHINDAWNLVRSCKTSKELEDLFADFPEWAGTWHIVVYDRSTGEIKVTRTFWDLVSCSYIETYDLLTVLLDRDCDLAGPFDD